jgi:hypothetical protein
MQTTTTVSLATFSTASRYPTASTVSTDPYTLLLGLFFRLDPFCSSRRRDSRHRRIKSSSPSSLKELAGEVFSCCGRDNSFPQFVLSNPAALSSVRRMERFRARSKDCASAMTPFGPVFAWKMVDGTVYVAVLDMLLDRSTSLSEWSSSLLSLSASDGDIDSFSEFSRSSG